ncbi:MAG TPA: hypothetical protein VHF89_18770, partial [Solirubrobacteraceae bacterium]|nr:hypothetical protein [Solirubrobacteraceae bacterium]
VRPLWPRAAQERAEPPAVAGRRTRFTVAASVGAVRQPLAGATVALAGRRARTDAAGRASLVLRPRRAGRRRVVATKPPLQPGTAKVRVLPRRRGR